MSKISIILLNIALFLFYNSSAQKTVVVKDIKGHNVPSLLFENLKDSIPFNLSDFAENIRFVRIENSKDILIGPYSKWLVSEEYIIHIPISQDGCIKQFTKEGKFLRNLISKGEGPDQYRMATTILISKGNSLLIIRDMAKPDYLICLNLKNGDKLDNIPLYQKGQISTIISNPDKSLTILYKKPFRQELKHRIIKQNLKGEFMEGYDIDFETPNANMFYRMSDMYSVNNQVRITFTDNNTIYGIQEKKLNPYTKLEKTKTRLYLTVL